MKVLMRFGSGVPDLPNLIGAYTKIGISPRQFPQRSVAQTRVQLRLRRISAVADVGGGVVPNGHQGTPFRGRVSVPR
jgi:hypothetical protein